MKFYETHYEEYINTLNTYNIHPELETVYNNIPKNISDFTNLIIYGPCGVGKYTQTLNIIKKYSNSGLKYEKKIKIQTDKQSYIYKISDIHYEVDMSLLGCNSKILWHELFLQIVDIISVKSDKKGIILCKNFHYIHTELLEIFYSYIQQYNHPQSAIQIRFIIISEHVSFLPNNILNCCKIISIKRPEKGHYINMGFTSFKEGTNKGIEYNIHNNKKDNEEIGSQNTARNFIQRISQLSSNNKEKKNSKIKDILNYVEPKDVLNGKELFSFSLINNKNEIPNDIFNIICDNIINEIENYENIVFTNFRDIIYDILIYNLDVSECLLYILSHFIKKNKLSNENISKILKKTYLFLKYYNNNYRPIYHLESIFFYIIMKLHDIEDEK
jgi:hypothetical protein